MARITGEPDPRQYADFGRKVAARLGAHRDWENREALLNTISIFADEEEFPGLDDEHIDLWREVADELGIGYDDGD